MSNRSKAQYYRNEFKELAETPSSANKCRAQNLYECLFVVDGVFEPYGQYDFHPGEMECNEALRALELHRHPDDHYLERRGVDYVMPVKYDFDAIEKATNSVKQMKYAVEQKYFDIGIVSVNTVKVPDGTPDVHAEEHGTYDFYRDVFDTPEEAEVFRQKCLKA